MPGNRRTTRLLTFIAAGAATAAVTASTVNAGPAAAQALLYSFQNTTTGRYLDSAGGSELSVEPQSGSGTQVFTVQGTATTSTYLLESTAQPGECATAQGIPWTVSLTPCDSTDIAQQWRIDLSSQVSYLQSLQTTDGCIADTGAPGPVRLFQCGSSANDVSWRPIAR